MKGAKKIILSLCVVAVFVAYSWQQRQGNSPTLKVNNEKPNQQKQTSSMGKDLKPNIHTPPPIILGKYKDGSYTGNAADAYYGLVQVKAVINNGKLTDIIFLQSPDDHKNSIFINSQADPWLKQEAIKAQSAKVDIISGATETSVAFKESLANALRQAL